jgi:hypothetical protein
VVGIGGPVVDWWDEMQVKHDAKTIQERRAATSSTAPYPSRTIYIVCMCSPPGQVLLPINKYQYQYQYLDYRITICNPVQYSFPGGHLSTHYITTTYILYCIAFAYQIDSFASYGQ